MKRLFILTVGASVMLAMLWAQDMRIESFNADGQLTFGELDDAESYSVEWAPAPSGSWSVSSKEQSGLLRFEVDGMVYGLISGEAA